MWTAREEMVYGGCWQKSSVADKRNRTGKMSNRGFGRCHREGGGSVCASTNDEKMEKEKRPIDNRLVLNKKTLNAHGAQKEEICKHH